MELSLDTPFNFYTTFLKWKNPRWGFSMSNWISFNWSIHRDWIILVLLDSEYWNTKIVMTFCRLCKLSSQFLVEYHLHYTIIK